VVVGNISYNIGEEDGNYNMVGVIKILIVVMILRSPLRRATMVDMISVVNIICMFILAWVLVATK
jgi:hypothetical protein